MSNEIHKEVAQMSIKKTLVHPKKALVIVFEFYCGHHTTMAYDKDLFDSYARSMAHGAVYKRCHGCEEEAKIEANEKGITYEELLDEKERSMFG